MLQMVAQHVLCSFDRSNCSVEKISLQFVYAAEHSLNKFLDVSLEILKILHANINILNFQKFAQMRIGCYFLRKEGKYYHLVQDKTARQHKLQSTPVNGPNFKSIATPSSLAEDSSEMSIYPQGSLSIPPGHYSNLLCLNSITSLRSILSQASLTYKRLAWTAHPQTSRFQDLSAI